MKNKLFIKTGTIVILLFSVVLFMSSSPGNNVFNQVNAALTGSKVQLKVNNGTVTCTGRLGTLNMGAVNAGFGSSTVSGTYAVPSTSAGWSCTDLNGSQTRLLAIRITGDLYNQTAHTISSGAAAICLMAAPAKLQGTNAASLSTTVPICTTTTGMVVTQELMKRSGTAGEIYQYGVQPRILVTIPASQAAGTYTGVLEVTIP